MQVLPLLPIFRQMRDGFVKFIYLCWSKRKYILQNTYVAVVGLAFECAKF